MNPIPYKLQDAKRTVVATYLSCAAWFFVLLPWHQQYHSRDFGTRDVWRGYHFIWQLGSLGFEARPDIQVLVITQLGILAAFGAIYAIFASPILTWSPSKRSGGPKNPYAD